MKKLAKKLALHKETLIHLDGDRLGRAAWGGTNPTYDCGTLQTCGGGCAGTLACSPTEGACTGTCTSIGCTANQN